LIRATRRRLSEFENQMLLWFSRNSATPVRERSSLGRRMTAKGFRALASSPRHADGTPTAHRVNQALGAIGGQRYLEIGVHTGRTLESVTAPVVVGVDPSPLIDLGRLPPQVTIASVASDDYFSAVHRRKSLKADLFDVVLVDGLHTFAQSYRDVINAFTVLSDIGLVIVDDTVPADEFAALSDRNLAEKLRRKHGVRSQAWMGDVYRTVLAFHQFHPVISIATVSDQGHRPQTFMWVAPAIQGANRALHPAPASHLEALHSTNYREVFAEGVPNEFNLCTMEQALNARLRDLHLQSDER
jgi:hypothetical protein